MLISLKDQNILSFKCKLFPEYMFKKDKKILNLFFFEINENKCLNTQKHLLQRKLDNFKVFCEFFLLL